MLSYWNQPAGGDMERKYREKLIDSLLLSATLWLKVSTVDLKLPFMSYGEFLTVEACFTAVFHKMVILVTLTKLC